MRERLMAIPPAAAVCFSLLALATLGVYGQLLAFDFVDYDDPFFVVKNAFVRNGFSAEGITWALTTGAQSNWHPLTWYSHMLDAELFGLNSAGHHATALGLHVANTLLVFGVLRAMTGATWRSAAVAGLFSLHPLHVENVAWVSARGNILSTFFGLIALAFYVRHVQGRQSIRLAKDLRIQSYGIVLACFVLSLMAKPMWIMLPFALLILDYWPLGRFRGGPSAVVGAGAAPNAANRHSPLELVREKFPLFAIGGIATLVTYAVQSAGNNTAAHSAVGTMPLVLRISNAIVSYVQYLGKTLWPAELSPLYPHPFMAGSGGAPWSVAETLAAAALLLVITAVAIRLRSRRPYALVGWLWFVGTLLPVIGFIQIGMQGMADRYTYIPLIGLFVAFVWAAGDLAGRAGRLGRVAVSTAMVLLLAASGVASYLQSQHWADGQSLSRRVIEVTPGNPTMLVSGAAPLARQGNYKEAKEFYQRALETHPGFGLAHIGLGQIHLDQGHTRRAIKDFRKAVAPDPKNSYYQYRLGVALAQAGQVDEALAKFEAALKHLAERQTAMDPDPVDLHLMIGNAHHVRGRVDEALRSYRKGLKLAPERAADFQGWIEQAESEQNLAARLPRLARSSAKPKATPARYTQPATSPLTVPRRFRGGGASVRGF